MVAYKQNMMDMTLLLLHISCSVVQWYIHTEGFQQFEFVWKYSSKMLSSYLIFTLNWVSLC